MKPLRGYTLPGFVVGLLLVYTAGPARAQDAPPDNCRTCHGSLSDTRLGGPAQDFPNDVHAAKGFSCVACHGGDPTAPGLSGMDPAKGFVAKPVGREVLQVCGRCHSDAQFMRRYNPSLRVDQVSEYVTSVHGQRLAEANDTSVATCVSCHPAHNIRPPADPLSSVHPLNVVNTCGHCHADSTRMAPYSIPVDQVARYHESIHWYKLSEEGDLSAPTCNDCHGNHGAAPPGVDWVGNVCGQCHSVMADLYEASRHSQFLSMLGAPGCATCHQNHAVVEAHDAMLGVGPNSVCGRCHVADVGGGRAAVTMRSGIDSLITEFDLADSLLTHAERAGVEVSEAQFALGNAQTALVQARAAVHAFNVDSVAAHLSAGREVTGTAVEHGYEALDELRFRRTGLAVSVTIILVVIAGLVLKIREIER